MGVVKRKGGVRSNKRANQTHHRKNPLRRSFGEDFGGGDLVVDPAVLQKLPEDLLVGGLLREVELVQHRRPARGAKHEEG